MKSALRRTLSSPRLQRKAVGSPVRRNTAHFETPSREWLQYVRRRWQERPPHLHRESSLDSALTVLHRLPVERSPSLQLQVEEVRSVLWPHASEHQADKLADILFADVLVKQPTELWTRETVALLSRFGAAELQPLALRWAAEQEATTCLREECPLVWLLQARIPSATSRFPDDAEAFLHSCLRRWKRIDAETLALLRAVQQALPLGVVEGCPTIFYFALFRCWLSAAPQHKQLLQRLNDKRIAKAAQCLV